MLTMTAVGRIGRDVEVRFTGGDNSQAVCNVVIGCNYGRKGDDGNHPTQWVEGTIWGQRAEALAEYLTKGKQVILDLRDVHIETYQGTNGPGHKLVGTVQDLAFGATPQGDQGGGNGGGQQRQQPRGNGGGYDRGGNGGGQARGNSGGQRNSYAEGRGRQQPAAAPRAPAAAKAPSGFDDMDDDIPF